VPQQLHEDVLGGVHGAVLVAQELAAAAHDHGTVALVEGVSWPRSVAEARLLS
jgi:hypothetical protein